MERFRALRKRMPLWLTIAGVAVAITTGVALAQALTAPEVAAQATRDFIATLTK